MTNISDLHTFMWALLGDSEVMGEHNYPADVLTSAVRTVLALGEGPEGYALVGSKFTATAIAPDLEDADDLALILYKACEVIVRPTPGKMSYRTRGISASDDGEGRRSLLAMLEEKIFLIENGGTSVFLTWQSVAQFCGCDQSPWESAKINLTNRAPDITV